MNKRFLLFLIVIATSCDVSYFDHEVELKWSGDVNMPIGSINYSLTDVFQELDINDLDEDSEGNLSFNYIKSISGEKNTSYGVAIEDLSTFIEIETPLLPAIFDDAGVTSPHTIVASEIAPGTPNPLIRTEEISKQVMQKFELSKSLSGASFTDGELIIDIASTLSTDVIVTIEIPSLITKTLNSTYQTSQTITPFGTQLTIPLENYIIDFSQNAVGLEPTTNNFVINVSSKFDFKIGDTVTDDEKISVKANLIGSKTSVIYGDFKQERFSFSSQSLRLDFFENFGQGAVTFANPKIKIKASNGYGFPIGINLSNIRAKNKTDSLNLRYDGDQGQENTIIVNGIETYSSSATPEITEIIIDKTNSNFSELLSLKPTEIILDVDGNANPINKLPNFNFFATINDGFQAELEIEAPLEVKFENIELTKSIEFDYEEEIEDLVNFTLVLNTENSIPLSGNLKLLFMKNGVDLNVSKSFIAFDAADVESNGKSNGYKTTATEVTFSENDLEKIKTATSIDIKCILDSPKNKDEVILLGINDLVVNISAKTSITL
jgi:hypothetical protein